MEVATIELPRHPRRTGFRLIGAGDTVPIPTAVKVNAETIAASAPIFFMFTIKPILPQQLSLTDPQSILSPGRLLGKRAGAQRPRGRVAPAALRPPAEVPPAGRAVRRQARHPRRRPLGSRNRWRRRRHDVGHRRRIRCGSGRQALQEAGEPNRGNGWNGRSGCRRGGH
jgi:hypothetical protein